MGSGIRIGVDVGGTFTDLVALDEDSGDSSLVKLPSSPGDPSEAVLEGFRQLGEIRPERIASFVHASTVGTNLFLGQLGLDVPRGALVTTAGFRDVLEIGRQRRADLYDPFFERPEPLIERHLRFTVDERMSAAGEALRAINEHEVRAVAGQLREQGVDAVAIVFLHAYTNPLHESIAKDILAEELPDRVIVASHEVDPEYREYERTSTTVVNCLLIPVLSRYLRRIQRELQKAGVHAPIHVMQSNGGLSTVEMACTIPVATIESGPATGVLASAHWSRMLGIERTLSFDMGGTTAKAGAIINGLPQMTSEVEVGGRVHSGRAVRGSGYPVRYPFVDLAEVSGGGGTIAWVDHGNQLGVGPLSAGADPGPACYGQGGEAPTVTDANLLLGRLSPAGLSGGEIALYRDAAEESLRRKIAKPLGITLEQAAQGIIEIVNQHMMRALRLVSIERGHDPRDFAMLAFGGAGPMHAAFLARELGVGKRGLPQSVVIPPSPGLFSALGLLLADFRHDFVRSIMQQASELHPRRLAEAFREVEREAIGVLRREGFAPSQAVLDRRLHLRYLGQSYELAVPIAEDMRQAVDLFHRRHQETYGYAAQGEPVEVVNVHVVARGVTEKPQLREAPLTESRPSPQAIIDRREVFFEETGWEETEIYARHGLRPGNRIEGPAIVEQYDATVVIPPGCSGQVDGFSNLHLQLR
jgi:N-methylhydantoinase A